MPYSEYPRFQEVMAEDSGQTVVSALIDSIIPLVPGLPERLASGIDVLDVGCGSGRAIILMAEHFPASRFAGYDIDAQVIASAGRQAEERGLQNVRFEARDVTRLGETAAYDLITTFDAVHDQVAPDAVLKGIAEALRPDGVYLMQDISASSHVENNVDHPIGPFLYTISCMHCMTVSLSGGGAGLGTMWGRELALEMLADAGFSDVSIENLAHDFHNDYYVARK